MNSKQRESPKDSGYNRQWNSWRRRRRRRLRTHQVRKDKKILPETLILNRAFALTILAFLLSFFLSFLDSPPFPWRAVFFLPSRLLIMCYYKAIRKEDRVNEETKSKKKWCQFCNFETSHSNSLRKLITIYSFFFECLNKYNLQKSCQTFFFSMLFTH